MMVGPKEGLIDILLTAFYLTSEEERIALDAEVTLGLASTSAPLYC